jgi:hypothetical protein
MDCCHSSRPLLERKRRARINACLDELKDLMMFALEQESREEGGGVVRLEKTDVLELTVRYMRKLKAAGALCVTPGATYAQKFRYGYATCAAETRKFIAAPGSGFEPKESGVIIGHLSERVDQLTSLPSSSCLWSSSHPLDDPAANYFEDQDFSHDLPMDLSQN